MAKTRIDNFGRKESTGGYLSPIEPMPYQIATDGSTTYVSFFDTNPRAIHRITTAGDVKTVEFAFGKWDDRAILTYIPINNVMEVEA